MHLEIAEKWITALRSGDYKQARGMLADRKRETYCCLGVLCEIAIKEGVDVTVSVSSGEAALYDGSEENLPASVSDWAGIDSSIGILDSGISLVGENDRGISFEEIAAVIEAHVEEL